MTSSRQLQKMCNMFVLVWYARILTIGIETAKHKSVVLEYFTKPSIGGIKIGLVKD
jgi:hypothetical protein